MHIITNKHIYKLNQPVLEPKKTGIAIRTEITGKSRFQYTRNACQISKIRPSVIPNYYKPSVVSRAAPRLPEELEFAYDDYLCLRIVSETFNMSQEFFHR